MKILQEAVDVMCKVKIRAETNNDKSKPHKQNENECDELDQSNETSFAKKIEP